MRRLTIKIWNIIRNFILLLWNIVKNMKTWRGLLSLFIAFMILEGWAFVFVGIGTLMSIHWMYSIGIVVLLFWFGPATPLTILIVLLALAIQRFIFRDKSNVLLLRTELQKMKRMRRKRKLARKIKQIEKEEKGELK